MKNGIIENPADARWLSACGVPYFQLVDVFVSALKGVSLWYAYELARHSRTDDIRIDKDGEFLIYLDFDEYGPGWFYYKKRAKDEDEARAYILAKLGDVVRIPMNAYTSDKDVVE